MSTQLLAARDKFIYLDMIAGWKAGPRTSPVSPHLARGDTAELMQLRTSTEATMLEWNSQT